jgi:hypothetical protein
MYDDLDVDESNDYLICHFYKINHLKDQESYRRIYDWVAVVKR